MQILQITYEGGDAKMEEWCKLQAEHYQTSQKRGILEYCIWNVLELNPQEICQLFFSKTSLWGKNKLKLDEASTQKFL